MLTGGLERWDVSCRSNFHYTYISCGLVVFGFIPDLCFFVPPSSALEKKNEKNDKKSKRRRLTNHTRTHIKLLCSITTQWLPQQEPNRLTSPRTEPCADVTKDVKNISNYSKDPHTHTIQHEPLPRPRIGPPHPPASHHHRVLDVPGFALRGQLGVDSRARSEIASFGRPLRARP